MNSETESGTTGNLKTTDNQSKLEQSRFLKACRCEPVDCTPIWLMRQAGRYMAEYRKIREHHSMLEVIGTPKLAAEVTMQPIEAFDLDAAIIFSDILPPLIGMGLELDFVKGVGPKLENPIKSVDDVNKLTFCKAVDCMGPTLEAIQLVRKELEPRGIPLIGFAGAPFTLACYAIQGSGSKVYELAKQFMFTHPQSWDELMGKLVDVVADYLIEQAKHGASALQVFDSWAGVLSAEQYSKYIAPHNRRLFELIQVANVPLINFSTGTATHLDRVANCGGDVIGVDWRLPLDTVQQNIGRNHDSTAPRFLSGSQTHAIQGNLDPTALLAPWAELKTQTDEVLESARSLPRHIFNLGHGILPPTPIESVRELVNYVHEKTSG